MSFPNRRVLRVMLAATCAVVLIAGARAITGLLNPVLIAGFLALLFQPLLHRLRRARGGAVFLIVLLVVVGSLLLIGFMVASLRQLALEFPRYQTELEALIERASAAAAARGIDGPGYVRGLVTGENIGRIVLGITGWIAGSAGSFVLTLFVFAFMLGGMWELERRARADAADHSPLAARFLGFSATIRGYMGVRTVLGLAAALLNYILLLILGVDYAALWAVLSFILSFVPNVGFVLSLVPPLLLALLEKGWVAALIVFAGYQLINTLIDNVIGPRFIGRQMKISALLSFLSVLFWAWVLGPPGAILSVPLTVLIRDLATDRGDVPDLGSPVPVTSSSLPSPEPEA